MWDILRNGFCPCLLTAESQWPPEAPYPCLCLRRTCSKNCRPWLMSFSFSLLLSRPTGWTPCPTHSSLLAYSFLSTVRSFLQCLSCPSYFLAPLTLLYIHLITSKLFHPPELLLDFWNSSLPQVSHLFNSLPFPFPQVLFCFGHYNRNVPPVVSEDQVCDHLRNLNTRKFMRLHEMHPKVLRELADVVNPTLWLWDHTQRAAVQMEISDKWCSSGGQDWDKRSLVSPSMTMTAEL